MAVASFNKLGTAFFILNYRNYCFYTLRMPRLFNETIVFYPNDFIRRHKLQKKNEIPELNLFQLFQNVFKVIGNRCGKLHNLSRCRMCQHEFISVQKLPL